MAYLRWDPTSLNGTGQGEREVAHERGSPPLPVSRRLQIWFRSGALHPLTWISLLWFGFFHHQHAIFPFFGDVRMDGDSFSYLAFGEQSWLEALGYNRTLAYPLLIHGLQTWRGDLALLPLLQSGLHLLAVIGFWGGLRVAGLGRWSAFAAAAPLIFAHPAQYYGNRVMTDAPAFSASLLALGALFAVVSRSGRLAWTLLTLLLMAAYHLRPAYLFLIPLTPMLGAGLLWLRRRAGVGYPPIGPTVVRLSLCALLPFLLFSAMRWAAVGHFGLVSFGGGEVSGVATSLLTPELVEELDPVLQPLAGAILAERQARGLDYPIPAGGCARLSWNGYQRWYDAFNTNLHQINWVQALALTGGSRIDANILLRNLSHGIIRAAPGSYLCWVTAASVHALMRLKAQLWDDPHRYYVSRALLTAWALLAILVAVAGRGPGCRAGGWIRNRRWVMALGNAAARGRGAERGRARSEIDGGFAVAWIGLAAGIYFLGGAMLVVLVEQPLSRYLGAAGGLFPPMIALLAWERAGRLKALLLGGTRQPRASQADPVQVPPDASGRPPMGAPIRFPQGPRRDRSAGRAPSRAA